MTEIRPELADAYESLCYQGQQFPEPHPTVELEDLTFYHPRKGVTPIKLDTQVLAMQGAIYTGDSALQAALQAHSISSQGSKAAADFLSRQLDPSNEPLVWGFSGYATGGINEATGKPFGYRSEAVGLCRLYDYLLAKNKAPGLAIDGGVSEGFLALNSIVARSAGIPTLGFIPRQGLASVGIRDHLVVAGNTYKDRETLVGTADMLVFAGGAEGTIRECVYAVRRGAGALILNLVDYPPSSLPNTFMKYDDLRQAYDKGRLAVCNSFDKIGQSVEQVLSTDVKVSRPQRNAVITDFLFAESISP